jgi:ornithine cyclodeaminase/alanine dehydrogenase-like protein (mu-crystallin family)
MIGAGVQARSHLAILAEVLPAADLVIADRHADRAESVALEASESGAFRNVRGTTRSVEAIEGADIVLGLVSFGSQRQSIPVEAFARDALVVAVDYDMSVPAALADEAGLFVVDERGQFLANRSTGIFAGYPDPAQTIGEALLAGTPRPAQGRTLVTHLGVGLADLIFADAVLRRNAEPA